MISKSIVYAFLAMWLYAFTNVAIEVRLSKYTTMALLLYWYFTLAPLAVAGLGYMYLSGQNIVMPRGSATGTSTITTWQVIYSWPRAWLQ